MDESFNQEFCDTLEFHLCRTFENSDREEWAGIWCDGISSRPLVDSQITKKSVNDTRRIETQAWLGKTGQDNYKMTVNFGKYSLRRYASGKGMLDCIPSESTHDWIIIDFENSTIEITLK